MCIGLKFEEEGEDEEGREEKEEEEWPAARARMPGRLSSVLPSSLSLREALSRSDFACDLTFDGPCIKTEYVHPRHEKWCGHNKTPFRSKQKPINGAVCRSRINKSSPSAALCFLGGRRR